MGQAKLDEVLPSAPSPANWHERFKLQAAWTEQARRYLLGRMALRPGERVLEVGCGTGAITSWLYEEPLIRMFGIDLKLDYLRLARGHDRRTRFAAANALQLPFPADRFAAVVCHFFLLWVPQPAEALAEMVRAARPGGWVAAFAEPDYGGRIDYPAELAELGGLQTAALLAQGADPLMGRKLAGLFRSAGLLDVETGLLGGQWHGAPPARQWESEWSTLEADLSGTVPPSRLAQYRQIDAAAWQSGERVLFVPTFYALGRKP